MRYFYKNTAGLCLAAGMMLFSMAASADSYVFNALGGVDNDVEAYGMNNLGQTVGADTISGAAEWWNGSGWSLLNGIAGSDQSFAQSINDSGQIAGYAHILGADAYTPVVWSNGTPSQLQALGTNYPWAGAWVINNSGETAGNAWNGNQNIPVAWDSAGNVSILPTNGASTGVVVSSSQINASGEIIGAVDVNNNGGSNAIAWLNGSAAALASLGGDSAALGLNNQGQIVGGADALGHLRPVIWLDAQHGAVDLGTLGGANGVALSINDNGLIVGYSDAADGSARPTLWDHGKIIDLSAYFIPGWTIKNETYDLSNPGLIAINDAGTILGNLYSADGVTAYQLNAVPVPGAMGLFASAMLGLAGLGVTKRKA